jgi:hypothetical protein
MTKATKYTKLEYRVHRALTRLPRVLRDSNSACDAEIFSANAARVFSNEAGELSSRCEGNTRLVMLHAGPVCWIKRNILSTAILTPS